MTSPLTRMLKLQQANRINVQRNASGTVQFSRSISGGSKISLTPVKSATDQSTTITGTKAGNFIKVAGAVKALGGGNTGKVSLTLQTFDGTTTNTIKSTTTTGTNTTSVTFTTTLDEPNTPIVKAKGTGTAGTGTLVVDVGVGAKVAPKDDTDTIAAP